MQINSVNNYKYNSAQLNNRATQVVQNNTPQVAFGQGEENTVDSSKSMRNLIYGLMMLGATATTTTACDPDCDHCGIPERPSRDTIYIDYLNHGGNCCHGCHNDSVEHDTIYIPQRDTITINNTDTIVDTLCLSYQRPLPLDSLFHDLKIFDIDGTGDNEGDPISKRNLTHYEATREWEYGTREIGDMNQLESSRDKLVYDYERQDYMGNHESYGKQVFRYPTTNFSIVQKDGTVINNPKGLFVENFANDFDDKNASIEDCELLSRCFITTKGDTIYLSTKGDAKHTFVEKGNIAKGYLGQNTILLNNLIGIYDTQDHLVDVKTTFVSDADLKDMYRDAAKAKYYPAAKAPKTRSKAKAPYELQYDPKQKVFYTPSINLDAIEVGERLRQKK